MLYILNSILVKLNLKLIKTSDSFKWMGKEFHLPMKIERYSDKIRISDYFNNPLPIEFNNEEEARFVLNVLDVAINPYK